MVLVFAFCVLSKPDGLISREDGTEVTDLFQSREHLPLPD
jgi:hypothetical protein